MMTERQKRYMYNILEKNNVFVSTNKTDIPFSKRVIIDTYYYFGNYRIEHSTTFPVRDDRKELGDFYICKKGETLASWNELAKAENKYVYYAYIAAKNKSQGKPYINPYKVKKSEIFSKVMSENQCLVFPDSMPNDKRIDAIEELKQILQKHIAPYRTK